MKPLQKLPKNVGDLAKLIVAKGFKKLPKVRKIAKSGHTERIVHIMETCLLLADVKPHEHWLTK